MQKSSKSLFELLGTVKDPRRGQGQRHRIETVLTIVILGIMSGQKGERAICRFAANNRAELLKLLAVTRKEVPSRSVFQNVMQNIDFEELTAIFSKWALALVTLQKSDWIGIDGKAIGGTVTDSKNAGQNFISLVTVFASKRRQILAAGRISNKKESEIPKVRALIRVLNLEGHIFTLDALHCQKKTVQTIIESGNDYVIGVKGNQKKLYEQVKKTARERR
jgi:hypothetical protein